LLWGGDRITISKISEIYPLFNALAYFADATRSAVPKVFELKEVGLIWKGLCGLKA
jgi:hypothetical protein